MHIDALDEAVTGLLDRMEASECRMVIVTGSGWDSVLAPYPVRSEIPYADLPLLGAATVDGHAGSVALLETPAGDCLAFRGRRHWYECLAWEPVVFPAYAAVKLTVDGLLLTNAAGGIHPEFNPGELMIIDDHINAMGVNPLAGPHDKRLGKRFADQSRVYHPALRAQLDRCAHTLRLPVRHGVYAAVAGPTYETPAEANALGRLGADAVGMSTVPEAMVAAACGIPVCALSCITNTAAGQRSKPLSHADVVATGRAAAEKLRGLLWEFLSRFAPPAVVES